MSLALMPVAHSLSSHQAIEECSVCISQPSTDANTNSIELISTVAYGVYKETVFSLELVTSQLSCSPFYGRAPPASA